MSIKLLEAFAEGQRRRLELDEDGPVLRGADGFVYDWDDGSRLAVTVVGAVGSGTWARARRAFESAGVEVIQNGDDEGCAVFSPATPAHVTAVCKAIRLDHYVSGQNGEDPAPRDPHPEGGLTPASATPTLG